MNQAFKVKNITVFFLGLLFLSFFSFPIKSFAAPSDKTKAGVTGITYECGDEKTAGECDFNDLLKAVEHALNYLVTLTLSFSVVVIAYAGYLYMISGDNPGKRKEANNMLTKVAMGIFFILAAWLIVSLILKGLGVDSPVEFK